MSQLRWRMEESTWAWMRSACEVSSWMKVMAEEEEIGSFGKERILPVLVLMFMKEV